MVKENVKDTALSKQSPSSPSSQPSRQPSLRPSQPEKSPGLPPQPELPEQSEQVPQPPQSPQPPQPPKQTFEKPNTEEEKRRFEVELEFVQCLANPSYLNFLGQHEYFDSEDFIAYLNYLQYWRTPPYARFVVYPHALYFLRLLQEPAFREAIKRTEFATMVHEQQGLQWCFGSAMKPMSDTIIGSGTKEGGEENSSKPQAANGRQSQNGAAASHSATVT